MTAGVAGHIIGGPAAGIAMGLSRAGLGKLARGGLDRGARNAAQAVRAEVALPNGLPQIQLPRLPATIDGVARRIAVRAENPGLEKKRAGLLDLLEGR